MRRPPKVSEASVARDIVVSRISHAGQTRSLVMTRRSFLLGSTGAMLSPSLVRAEIDAPEFEYLQGGGFKLSYRSCPENWSLSPDVFAGNTSLALNPEPSSGYLADKTTLEFEAKRFLGVGKIATIKARLERINGTWMVLNQFHIEDSFQSPMPLKDWIEGKQGEPYWPYSQIYSIADKYRLSVRGRSATVRWDKNLNAEFRDDDNIFYLDKGADIPEAALSRPAAGQYGFVADRVVMSARETASEALVALEPSAAGQPSTALTFSGVRTLYLGKTNTGQALSLALANSEISEAKFGASVSIEAFERNGLRKAVLVVDGSGTLVVASADGAPQARIQLETISIVGRVGNLAQSLAFAAKVARKPFDYEREPDSATEEGFGVNAGGLAVKISGTDETIVANFSNGQTGSLVLPTKLLRAHVPVEGASRAELRFANTDIDVVIGRRYDSATPTSMLQLPAGLDPIRAQAAQETYSPRPAELTIENAPSLNVPLDRAELHLARSVDHFNLRFRFQNYLLKVENGGSHLLPHWDYLVGSPTSSTPRRVAIFGPQHVQEEVFFYKRPDVDTPTSLSGAPLQEADPDKPISDQKNETRVIRPVNQISNEKLAQTRVALPTRLVFEETSPDDAALRPTEITVETITDWTELALVVHERALPRNASLEEQLAVADITPGTSRNNARAGIVRSFSEPTDWQTALEPVTGLIFSPDASGKFLTPRRPPAAGRVPIWSADLSLPENAAVRAIYARGLDQGFLFGAASKDRSWLPYETSLNAKDRREIVAMTSLYGLAALRRLVPNEDRPSEGLFRDDPKGMVIRPDMSTPYAYLSPETRKYGDYEPGSDANGIDVFQEGIMIPKPFVDFNLSLSANRASLGLRWEGEPPAPLVSDPFFGGAFNIESYVHETLYGRDVLVQVTYKGFLFPLGHRAAYIRLSERTMLPFADNPEKFYPTGKLTVRFFIVVRKPKKAFPALNQPNASRAFPADEIEMVTTVTPDLEPPEQIEIPGTAAEPLSRNRDTQGARIFWPRTSTQPDSEVIFDYRINGDATPARSKLIFVDNTAAHSPSLMKLLVEGYSKGEMADDEGIRRGLGGVRHSNTVFHAAVDRKYAATAKHGETSLNTDTWQLSAEGRAVSKDATESAFAAYEMDAFMEGKDQSPWFPVLSRASVRMQSVDRMLGKPQGPITVKFNDDLYVKHGFDNIRNPSEIYLEVISPAISLDFTNQGKSSGGIAKPNATLAAVSRSIGLVGGKVKPRPNTGSANLVSTSQQSLEVGFDFSGAKAGQFDPTEFLPDGKILGILEIRDLVQAATILAAPQLKEVYEFGGLAIFAIRDNLIKITPVISASITQSIAAADKALTDALPGNIDTTDLYPELVDQLKVVAQACDAVALRAGDLAFEDDEQTVGKELFPTLTQLYSEGDALVKTIEDVIDNPTPEIVGKSIEQFYSIRKTIETAIGEFDPKALLSQFKDVAFMEVCDILIENRTFELLFGPVAYEGTDRPIFVFPEPPPSAAIPGEMDEKHRKDMLKRACLEMLEHPEQVLPNLQRSLFYEVYGRVTSQLMLELKKVDLGVDALLLWSRRKLSELLSGLLKRGFLESRIALVDDTTWAIVALVDAQLKKPIDLTNPKADLQRRLNSLEVSIEKELRTFKAAIKVEARKAAVEQEKRLKAILEKEEEALRAKTQEAIEALEAEIRRLEAEYAKYVQIATAAKSLAEELAKTDPKKLAAEVAQAIEKELKASLDALEDELKARAKKARDDLISRALGTALRLLDQLSETAKAQALSNVVEAKKDELCYVRKTSPGLYGLAVDVINFVPAAALQKNVSTANKALGKLTPPSSLSEGLRSQLLVEISSSRASLARFADICQNFVRIQSQLSGVVASETDINICKDLKKYIEPIEQAYELQRSASSALGDVFIGLDGVTQTVRNADGSTEFKRLLREEIVAPLLQALTEVSGVQKLAANAQALLPASLVDPLKQEAANFAEELKVQADDIEAASVALKTRLDDAKTRTESFAKGELKRLSDEAAELVSDLGKKLIARLLQGLVMGSETVGEMSKATAGVVQDVTSLLESVLYTPTETALGKLESLLGEAEADDNVITQLLALLGEPAREDFKKAKELVSQEKQKLAAIRAAAKTFSDTQSIASAEALVNAIKALTAEIDKEENGGKPALVRAVEIVNRMIQLLASGQLDKLFDLGPLKDQLLEAISDLIPARVQQSYDWDTRVNPFPSNGPIFEIDRALEVGKPESYGVILPKNKKGEINDLVLSAGIDINLLTGERRVVATGRMRPFKIHLLGSAIDLATIGFKGMEVISVNGAKPEFKADIAEVEIGQALSFIEALAPFFGPKPDDGPYVRFSLAPLGVEAGYKFSAPVIVVGAILFSGVAISVEMVLPFENQQATFSFAFASRRKPFFVVVPPFYAGGGFVGLLASPKGVIGFEIQVEFGAVVPIEFGPLKASGRVTAGIYLMSRPGQRIIEGFVRAIGEGNIACFSIFVCIEVTIRQENGGKVTGSASYTVKIDVGLFDVTYGFTASYAVQGGAGTSETENEAETFATTANCVPDIVYATYDTGLPDRRNNWARYKSHFGHPTIDESK